MIRQLTVAAVVLGVALAGSVLKGKDDSMTAVDSINFLCQNLTEDKMGVPQSLGRCYNRYFVCSYANGERVWESFACDECMKFDEDAGECRAQSQIEKCNVDADGYDILDIDDVLLACDKIQFDSPIFASNPKKTCSNVYMQCAINTMGVEDEFRYDVIAGGILYCDNTTMAFDKVAHKCRDKQLVDACLNVRVTRQIANVTVESENATLVEEGVVVNGSVVAMEVNSTFADEESATMLANDTAFDNATAENSSAERPKRQVDNATIAEPQEANASMPLNLTGTVSATESTVMQSRRKRQAESNSTTVAAPANVTESSPAQLTENIRRKRQSNETFFANETLIIDDNATTREEPSSMPARQVFAENDTIEATNATGATLLDNSTELTRRKRQAEKETEAESTTAESSIGDDNSTADEQPIIDVDIVNSTVTGNRAARHTRAVKEEFEDDFDFGTASPMPKDETTTDKKVEAVKDEESPTEKIKDASIQSSSEPEEEDL